MAWIIKRNGNYYIGWREGTKDRYESTRTSDPEIAERKRLEKELQCSVAEGPLESPQPQMTLDALSELYRKGVELSPKTHWINSCSWGHFKRVLENPPIGKITTESIITFKKKMLTEKYSAASISLYLRDINKLLGFATEKGLIRWNPCKKAGSRKWVVEHPEEELTWRFLTKEEEEKLLAVCNPLLKRICIVALETGLRISQLISMEWKRYDPKTQLYTVPKQKRQKVRHIPIFARALAAMGPMKMSGFVFPGTNQDQIEHMFCRAVKRSGIGGSCTLHDLRHTYVSRVCEYLSPTEVRDLMGWSSVALVDRYTHSRTTDIQAKMRQHSSGGVPFAATPQVPLQAGVWPLHKPHSEK